MVPIGAKGRTEVDHARDSGGQIVSLFSQSVTGDRILSRRRHISTKSFFARSRSSLLYRRAGARESEWCLSPTTTVVDAADAVA